MLSFQSGQLGYSTNTIILKSNEHKSYAWVFGVICTFQSSQFFERLSMHFGVVDHIRASALTTADRRPPSWNRITDSTHAPPVGNGIGEPHYEHLDEMVYDDDKKCELLNKYFSLVSKLEEENIPVPPFESKTNDSITDIFVTASEIVDFIQILDLKKRPVLTKSAIKCSK